MSTSESGQKSLSCLLTFDVEEWFQTENLRPAFPRAHWERVPRRTVDATRVVTALLAEHGIRATFFILGWVAEREPALVREIADAGHEIAAHGYGHVLPMHLTRMEFRDDVMHARKVLEEISGKPVSGYRAPSFSLDHSHLEVLSDLGFSYDSSLHPFTVHRRYGRLDHLHAPLRPGVYPVDGQMLELALPVERLGRLQVPISGGAYFRFYPGRLFRRFVRRAIVRDGHYVMYLHSWEFDPAQPQVRVSRPGRRLRHYSNLARTLPRMRRLIDMLQTLNVRFVTAGEFVEDVRGSAHASSGPRGAQGAQALA